MKKLPLVVVDWIDSCSPSGNWKELEYAEAYSSCLIRSVGFLVKKDKTDAVLVQGYSDEMVHQVFAIPVGSIKKITKMKTP